MLYDTSILHVMAMDLSISIDFINSIHTQAIRDVSSLPYIDHQTDDYRQAMYDLYCRFNVDLIKWLSDRPTKHTTRKELHTLFREKKNQ